MTDSKLSPTQRKHYEMYAASISEDGVASVLRFHLLSEYFLEQAIRVVLPRGDKIIDSGNYSFAQKLGVVEAAQAFPDSLISSLRNLNKVRNKCSHELNHQVTDRDLETIGSPLGKGWTKIKNDDGPGRPNRIGLLFGDLSATMSAHLRHLEEKHHGEPKDGV